MHSFVATRRPLVVYIHRFLVHTVHAIKKVLYTYVFTLFFLPRPTNWLNTSLLGTQVTHHLALPTPSKLHIYTPFVPKQNAIFGLGQVKPFQV